LTSDWLAGRRLLVPELAALEGLPTGGLAYELSEWLKKQSSTSARDSKSATLDTIAMINDTLAMREIALGSIKQDFARDRCGRILAHLAEARNIYERNDLHKEQVRAINAHYNLFESVCAP